MNKYPSWRFDARDLRLHAGEFRQRPDRLKSRLGVSRLRWRPYDSLDTFTVLEELLTGWDR